jgi:Transport and Golgi organisation 2
MCTLSFVPGEHGYLVAMNRDELRTRLPALLPRAFDLNGIEVIHPREPAGGTWIACNAAGNLLALLNWHDVNAEVPSPKPPTRGAVIPNLIAETDSMGVALRFKEIHLHGMLPFRLIGIFRPERSVREWWWDGTRLTDVKFSWTRLHWFSSGLSDALAQVERRRTCEAAAQESDAWDEAWLAKVHRSHAPIPGPYSVCVHRADATTVSYTSVRCAGRCISMGYLEGNPCRKDALDALVTIAVRKTPVRAFSA